MKRILAITYLTLCATIISYSQTPCETEVSARQIDFQGSFLTPVNIIVKLNRSVTLSIHIVKDKYGNEGIALPELSAAINDLNLIFEPIALSFRQGEIDYIDNYQYNTLKKGDNEQQLLIKNYVKNTLNVYYVNMLLSPGNIATCSYAYFPGDSIDAVFINKSCKHSAYLIHQVGHILNLYHTHETVFGNELADGSNCSVSGDKCCDTPAQPDLSGNVDIKCGYTSKYMDSNNDYYIPSTANYMSFSNVDCMCKITNEQFIRVINTVLDTKSYLR